MQPTMTQDLKFSIFEMWRNVLGMHSRIKGVSLMWLGQHVAMQLGEFNLIVLGPSQFRV